MPGINLLASLIIASVPFSFAAGQSKFRIPAEYKTMRNPVAADSKSTEQGRLLYNKHCAYCHGNSGKGDGGKSRALKTSPKDLSAPKFQSLTPGEQFYSSKTGMFVIYLYIW